MTGVIILNYFSHEDTLRLYRQISEFPELEELEVLVVDNSCDRREAEILRREITEEHLLFSKKNRGYAGGNNLGIRKMLAETAGIDLIALLNPDINLRENVFPELRKRFEQDPRLAAAGPRLCLRNDEDMIYSDGGQFTRDAYLRPGHIHGGLRLSQLATRDQNTNQEQNQEIDYINGSFLMMRTEAIHDIGTFNEKFFLYFEEADWCMRAKKKGWSLQVRTDLVAWQQISEKEMTYNYYFLRSWFLFLHMYDRKGIIPLLVIQLKKIKWIMQNPDLSLKMRIRHVRSRLSGVVMGALNL